MSHESDISRLLGERQVHTPSYLEVAESVGGAAIVATEEQLDTDVMTSVAVYGADGSVVKAPEAIFGPTGAAAAQHAEAARQRDAVAAERVDALKTLEKDEFKLGDLNPLIHATDLTRKESVDAVRHTIQEKIQAYGGLLPEMLESAVVTDPESGKSDLRFIARFEVASLTEKQLALLEELIKDTYGITVRTRTDSKGNDIPIGSYPPTQMGEEAKSKTGGWYMGPAPVPTTSLHQGLFVYRDLGQINKDNFLEREESAGRYIIEIREAGQYQTDLVTFVTQVASVLAQSELPDRGQLLHETYYDLIRLGLKKVQAESVYGMDVAMDMIRRGLILPLANRDISGGVKQDPQSVLEIGVPGTGKTLVVEWLLQEDTGLFLLPIDPFELQKELAKPKEKQYLMPRIAQVARITGRDVILHVDDIENMLGENEATNSTLLNLMAGVQECGFYLLASTNYPEKINPSLIQPQRFSVLIHFGLQNERARYEILKIHANMESQKRKMPLFSSEELRDIILLAVAENTDGFTPRYLANVATVAKSHLVARVSRETGKTTGLTEEDLEGHVFQLEDWERALAEVSAKYDSESVKKRDSELLRFVKKHSHQDIGFTANVTSERRIFSPSILEKVAAAQARAEQNTTATAE